MSKFAPNGARDHSPASRMQIAAQSRRRRRSFRVMTADSTGPIKADVLPGLVESLGTLATDSTASIFNRLEAIEILLRLAIGPRKRPADGIDVAASHDARIVLSDAAPFLVQIMTSKNNRARIRLQAASLARLVGKLASNVSHAN
jgi:hypothetical protein